MSVLAEDIFVIPVGKYVGAEPEDYQLVYAPLAGNMLIATPDSVMQLQQGLKGEVTSGDVEEACAALKAAPPLETLVGKITAPADLQKMSVLPNHTCNFSCSYCYSAKGRSDIVLEREKLRKGLEYFIDPRRLKHRYLTLSFIGGGEPLLSWDLVRYGIEYATELADRGGFTLGITLVTNGSVMNEEMIGVLKRYGVLPDVSFDILPDIQNKQRKHYDRVCCTLDMLCDRDWVPSVNATITPDTVIRMEEMFDEMTTRFPKIQNMVFEPVVDDRLFLTPGDLRRFYMTYLDRFLWLRRKAAEQGKNITCRMYKNIDSILDRGCPGKFTLTPQGDIAICYCTSSPREKNYEARVYGKIDEKGVVLDEAKFRTVHGQNVFSRSKCRDCFAKWHCGGGCMCPNDLYTDDYLEVICDFTREMVVRVLLERIEPQYERFYNKSLREGLR